MLGEMKKKDPDDRLLGPDLFTTLTLKEAVKTHALTANCRKCGRWVEVNMLVLAEKYGGKQIVSEIAKRLRCRKCGSRERTFSFTDRAYFERHTKGQLDNAMSESR